MLKNDHNGMKKELHSFLKRIMLKNHFPMLFKRKIFKYDEELLKIGIKGWNLDKMRHFHVILKKIDFFWNTLIYIHINIYNLLFIEGCINT